MKWMLTIFIICTTGIPSIGQVTNMPVSEWVKKLSDPDDKQNQVSKMLFDSVVISTDTSRMNRFVQQFQANGNNHNLYFKTRLDLFRAGVLYYKDYLGSVKRSKSAVMQLMKEAMHSANESNNEYLVAYASRVYFSLAMFYKETELAVMYGMYSAELYEKLIGKREYPYYHTLAELMCRVREYEKCKDYCSKWLLNNRVPETNEQKAFKMVVLNTMALAYHRTARYDSAMHYYSKALAVAEQNNRTDWKGIINGNMGQISYQLKQYGTAIALLQTDYLLSMQYKYFDNSANALQWLARANVALGNKAKALQQVREAMTLIKLLPDAGYQQNIYYAAVETFKVNGLVDSAMYYSALYQKLHDSIEKKINTSSVAISKIRMNEEKNLYNIRRLQQDKKVQLQQRNFVILGILLLLVISVLIVNRQRIRFKYRQECLEKEKKIIEHEMAAAKQQMEMFTHNIIEKTSLIEKLEQQMKDNNSSAGQQETIAALSNLTILTEQDWDQFKALFEKIYPMFFQRLKTNTPDITVAEQRMAALTRLQLTTRQMASMQGISPDSVHKTRQRLRQRLGASNDTNLEEFFGSI